MNKATSGGPPSGLGRRASSVACQALLGVLVALSPASAQEDAAIPTVEGVDVLDVRLVNVEVWVQDRKGNPIPGLTAADFEVFEDGVPVELTHFAEIGGPPPRDPGPNASEAPGAARFERTQAATVVAAVAEDPPHLVIYFDQMHMGGDSVRRVAKDLRKFLDEGQVPAERVAILKQDFDLKIEADFGSTPEQLDAAMDRLAESIPVAGGNFDANVALGRMQQNWEFARDTRNPCRIMVNLTKAELNSRVGELRNHFTITLRNLDATARFLAGLPGLKMLVLVSDSLELRPGVELLRFAKNLCPDERDLDELPMLGEASELQRALVDFTRSANTNRVTFYPLQASGLTTGLMSGAENRAMDSHAVRGVDSLLRSVQQDGLLELADETGGVAMINRNSYRKPLEAMARDMTNYYSLAYTPARSGDGAHHSIDVRVARDGARVRHRQGYRDKSAAEVRDERLDGAIAFSLMDNPLEVRLAAGTLEEAGEGGYTMPLHLLVPSASLVFLDGERSVSRLEAVVRAREVTSGKQVEVAELLSTGRPPAGERYCALQLNVTLPPGIYVLGISLRDLATNVTSVVSTTVAIEDPQGGDSLGT